ncbi:MAG: hypothetical protein Q9211_005004, partial [Gyalolechia sp. 1 TL-2023]
MHGPTGSYILPFILLQSLLCLVHSLPPQSTGSSLVTGSTDPIQDSVVECDAQQFGDGLAVGSCSNALEKIVRSAEPEIYAKRPEREGEIAIPVRYLSVIVPTDDGSCAIDIIMDPEQIQERGDVANGIGISNAAKAIIKKCVWQSSAGGQKKRF